MDVGEMALAILQGVLEWLPVSSEGQLVQISILALGMPPERALNEALFLHLGTALAALVALRKEVADALAGIPRGEDFSKFVVVSVVVSALVGLPVMVAVKGASPSIGGAAMIAFSLVLVAVGAVLRVAESRGPPSGRGISPREGVVAGLAQGLAAIPGVSRSGSTVAALLLMGSDPEEALRASFLIGIPATMGASALSPPPELSLGQMAVLVSVSFAVGLISLRILLSAARRVRMSTFALAFGAAGVALNLPSIL